MLIFQIFNFNLNFPATDQCLITYAGRSRAANWHSVPLSKEHRHLIEAQ